MFIHGVHKARALTAKRWDKRWVFLNRLNMKGKFWDQ